ncbi:MAG: hypothetical protein HYY40_13775 [Bacteroidetes bacterium]|nr:hypothetical protein [Bacteroidota bacterium]
MSRYHIECRPEEILLLTIGHLTRDHIEHHTGNGSVCKTLSKGRNLIGLIDEDPERKEYQHDYYDELYKRQKSDEHDIRLSIDKKTKNRLVFIKPKFEPWIIAVARNSGLRMSDFNLSDDPDKLHGEINWKRTDLQKLLHKLMKIKSPAIVHLKKIISP